LRAKLLKPAHQLRDYPWSSYPAYLLPRAGRPAWLRVDRVLGEAGIPKDSPAGRREFARCLELRRWEEAPEIWKHIRRGWALGSKEFREELLAAMEERDGEYFSGEELRESDEQKAERLVREQLRKFGWTNADLKATRKGDLRKLRIAKQLSEHTTVGLKWISNRLHAGVWTHLNNRLYHVQL